MSLASSPLLLLRKPKYMLGMVFIKSLKFVKRCKIPLVILACPAFKGQEFKEKRALCGTDKKKDTGA